jgi:hypothetical protein
VILAEQPGAVRELRYQREIHQQRYRHHSAGGSYLQFHWPAAKASSRALLLVVRYRTPVLAAGGGSVGDALAGSGGKASN